MNNSAATLDGSPKEAKVVVLGSGMPPLSWSFFAAGIPKVIGALAVLAGFHSVGDLISAIQLLAGAEPIYNKSHPSAGLFLFKAAFWLAVALAFFAAAGWGALLLRPRYLKLNAAGAMRAVLACAAWYLGAVALVIWANWRADLWTAAIAFAGFISIGAGSRWFAVGRQRMVQGADEVLQADGRDPVVYLRSFDVDEALATGASSLEGRQGNFLTWRALHPAFWSERREWSFEEVLCRALSEEGAVIAIGKPDERLPKLGAARKYVADSAWREEVSGMLSKARFACLVIGSSEGLLWEVGQVFESGKPGRILLVVPQRQDAQSTWRAFVQKAPVRRVALPRAIPEHALAIVFLPDWTPMIFRGKPSISNYRRIVRYMTAYGETGR